MIARAAYELIREKKINRIYTGADTDDFKMSNLPEIVRDRACKLFSDPMAGCIDKNPIQGVYYFLYFLEVEGYDLGIVTSRPKPLHEPTRYIVHRDFKNINFNLGIHFANNADNCDLANTSTKLELLKELKPDVYFDDYLPYCDEAVKAGALISYLIQNKHTGWNKKATSTDDIKTIKNVSHVDWRDYGCQD